LPYEAKWPEFNEAVNLIAGRENRENERSAVAEELVAAIRAGDVKVRWPVISPEAPIPSDWSWFGPILGTGAFKDVLVCRADVDRCWRMDGGSSAADTGLPGAAEADTPFEQVIYRTGLPGKPTSWHLIEVEVRRRYGEGERHPGKLGESAAEWARVMIGWLTDEHKDAPPAKPKTLRNRLAPLLRVLGSTGPKP
jgi:hypothetical protein